MKPQEQSKRPNPDIHPSELWARIASSERPSKVVDFPRNDPVTGEPVGKLAIRVLTQAELMIASSQADKFAKELLKDRPRREEENRGYDDIYRNEAAVQILCRACRDSEKLDIPLFPSPAQVREKLTADEIAVLTRTYTQVQTDLGPIVADMSEEEVDAWVERLGKGGETYPLALLSSDAHDRLTLRLASRIMSSPTDKSSAGSPPPDSSTESIPEPDTMPPDEFADTEEPAKTE